MKVVVKISDIEIEVDRPDFKEGVNESMCKADMKDTILPTLEKAVEKALELYNNRLDKLSI